MRPSTLEKLTREATDNSLTFVEELLGQNNLYRFDGCGHTQALSPSKIRNNQFHCKSCFEDKIRQEANDCGLTFLKFEKGIRHLYRFNSCGHEKHLLIKHVRNHSVKCDICASSKINNDAEKVGLQFIKSINGDLGLYQFKKCGHRQEINKCHVRNDSFCCQTCEETYVTKKSGLYILKIKNIDTNFTWIKFGVSRDLNRRIKDYKLNNCHTQILFTLDVDTNKEATLFEKSIHRKYKEKKICFDFMKGYMKSGFTECYPEHMLSVIKKELSVFSQK